VRLQRYKDGGLSDVKAFQAEVGLTWKDSADTPVHAHPQGACRLARQTAAIAGRLAPKVFPRSKQVRMNATRAFKMFRGEDGPRRRTGTFRDQARAVAPSVADLPEAAHTDSGDRFP